MFTHMIPLKKITHNAHGAIYELHVFQVVEEAQYRIFVSKGALGLGPIYEVSQDVVVAARATTGVDMVDELLESIKGDIDRNEFGDF